MALVDQDAAYVVAVAAQDLPGLVGSRIAALRALVSEMPPAIAAQAVGYTAQCAKRHAKASGMTWANYVPARHPPASEMGR
ncbi:hypothetical protein [Streptomyces natalensis]|uniref:hypothetical protein n=1 Tax=Streptomyces natalensis TaxID=68242 RepID=UPI000A824C67|nr:hypothetical protein [Streptomyces natalensis]